jgi:hypothetical protein
MEHIKFEILLFLLLKLPLLLLLSLLLLLILLLLLLMMILLRAVQPDLTHFLFKMCSKYDVRKFDLLPSLREEGSESPFGAT